MFIAYSASSIRRANSPSTYANSFRKANTASAIRSGMSYQATVKAFLMGDVHINNHQHHINGSPVKVRRPLVVENLKHIISEAKALGLGEPKAQVNVLLNGDIFDLTESWPAGVNPASLTLDAHREVVKGIIDQIIDNNPQVIDALKTLLRLPNVRIVYNLGNHERWLNDTNLQIYLKDKLGLPDNSLKLTFSRRFYDPVLKLMAVHGDEFDPYCRPPELGEKMNDAEKFDILVIKRLLQTLPERLRGQQFTSAQIEQVQEVVRSIEYVRPIQRAFSYTLDNLNRISPQAGPVVMGLALQALSETVDSRMVRSLLAPHYSQQLLSRFICTPFGQFLLNRGTSLLVRRIRSDENQLLKARELLEAEGVDKDIRILVLGHTHKVLDETISFRVNGEKRHCRVMNPGSYKATILYPNPDATYPAGMISVTRPEGDLQSLEVDFNLNQKRIVYPANDS